MTSSCTRPRRPASRTPSSSPDCCARSGTTVRKAQHSDRKNLKLRRMLSVYDEQLHAAEKAGVSYSEFVAGLLRAQWHDRQESATVRSEKSEVAPHAQCV